MLAALETRRFLRRELDFLFLRIRWRYGLVGADLYILKPDETLMWCYEKG